MNKAFLHCYPSFKKLHGARFSSWAGSLRIYTSLGLYELSKKSKPVRVNVVLLCVHLFSCYVTMNNNGPLSFLIPY